MDYEEYIFHKYKDRALKGRKHFINEVNSKFRGVDGAELYKEIIDYQIMMYGSQLQNAPVELSCEQTKKGWTNRRNRRSYHGLKNYGRI